MFNLAVVKMKKERRKFSAGFRAKVAIEAIWQRWLPQAIHINPLLTQKQGTILACRPVEMYTSLGMQPIIQPVERQLGQ